MRRGEGNRRRRLYRGAGLDENTSNVEYWEEMRDILHSDHCGVMCKMRLRGQRENKSKGLEDVLHVGRNDALKVRRRKEEGRVGKIERELRELKEERRKIMKARKEGKEGSARQKEAKEEERNDIEGED